MTNKPRRGNKTSEHTRTKRAKRVIELAQAGATKQEIAADIGVSRVTLWRYLQALDVQFVESNREAIAELKKQVASEVAQQADNVLSGHLDPKAAAAWNGLISTFNKMLGLNAPKKTESLNVNVETDPQKLGPYQWFCFISRDLSFEEIKGPIAEVCDRLRAGKEPEPMPQPPKDSPLWHPTPKELPE
jgi:hypothetical protein